MSERDPLAEVDKLRADIARREVVTEHSIPPEYATLIDGATPDQVRAQAAAVVKLIQGQKQTAAPDGQTEYVGDPSGPPAPIPPPNVQPPDPRDPANLASLRAAAMTEPLTMSDGTPVPYRKTGF